MDQRRLSALPPVPLPAPYASWLGNPPLFYFGGVPFVLCALEQRDSDTNTVENPSSATETDASPYSMSGISLGSHAEPIEPISMSGIPSAVTLNR